uniref:DUF234 domain-containing protein n=1 Tax=Candidatus Methanogaster sp. ANME-2c ERB4 TaxID=2759911 RepID=A0A7G9YIX3_9EURY|nr:hypothetical protein DBNCDMDK_00046 [Methanosarcinales archaeon ANME-2c ERB4]
MGRYRDNEIDLLAMNRKSKEILFIECKWKNLRPYDAKKELDKLEEKSAYVRWDSYNKNFGLVAKSIDKKEELRESGYQVMDLEDFAESIAIARSQTYSRAQPHFQP